MTKDINYEWEVEHRQENNFAILEELHKYFEKYHEMRFIQGLWAVGIITRDKDFRVEDRFYEEPGQTLKKVQGNVHSYS